MSGAVLKRGTMKETVEDRLAWGSRGFRRGHFCCGGSFEKGKKSEDAFTRWSPW